MMLRMGMVVMLMMMTMVMMTMMMGRAFAKTVDNSGRRTKRSEMDGGEWSVWYNADKPWIGEGDFETTDHTEKTERICRWDREVAGAQCRVAGTNNTFDSSTSAFVEDHLLQACSSHGLICLNAQQRSGICRDYEVRFLCQALEEDNSSDSLFPNLDFKIYILLAAVPLLVIMLRLLWSCWCKPRIKRRRQQRRGMTGEGRQGQRGSLASRGSLSTSSSQASFNSALANPPPAYNELFGNSSPPHQQQSAIFSISGGECAGCGKCLNQPASCLVTATPSSTPQTEGVAVIPASPIGASPLPFSLPASPVTVADEVFVTPPSSRPSEVTVSSSMGSPDLRPSLPSSSSLQGAVAPPSHQPAPAQCTCTCHRLPSTAHVNLAFRWDSGDSGMEPSSPPPGAPAVYPGMHKPVFGFSRIGSFTSFTSYTSLPDYEEALEMLKKNGLFSEEEKL